MKKKHSFLAWICEDATGKYEPYLAMKRSGAKSAKDSAKILRDAKWLVRKVRVSYLGEYSK